MPAWKARFVEWMRDGVHLIVLDNAGTVGILDSRTMTIATVPDARCDSVCSGHDDSYFMCFTESQMAKVSLRGVRISVVDVKQLAMPGGPLPLRGLCDVSEDGGRVLFLARAKDFYWGRAARLAPSTAYVYDLRTASTVRATPPELGLGRAQWLSGSAIAFTAFEKNPANRKALDDGKVVPYDLYRVEVGASGGERIAENVRSFDVVPIEDAASPFAKQ